MRPLVTLAALTLCACRPAAPPEPRPTESAPAPAPVAASPAAEPVPIAAAPEKPSDDDADHCKCPAPSPADADVGADADAPEDTVDDDDPDARTRRTRARKKLPKPLATRLRAALPDVTAACDVALSGPCTIRGDFDGDGTPDDAVLVRARARAGGIALLWGTGAAELLGAGRHGQCWTTTEVPNSDGSPGATPCAEEISPDLDWLARWELRPRRLRDGNPVLVGRILKKTVESPAAGALGDGLLLDGGDAAAVLYRTADGWTLMHLGF